MFRLKLIPLLVCACLFAFPVMDAGAVGLGGYLELGAGSSSWDLENDAGDTAELDSDKGLGGIGFVLDTRVARNGIFNYRLQLGFETMTEETEADEVDFSCFTFTNDFGFAVMQSPEVRLWFGPELKLSFGQGSPDSDPDLDMSIVTIGIGPVFGANFNIGQTLTLAIKTGLLFTSFAGNADAAIDADDYDFDGTSSELFVNFAILFRINDSY